MKTSRLRCLVLALSDFIFFYACILLVATGYGFFGGNYSIELYARLYPYAGLMVLLNGLSGVYHGHMFYPGAALSWIEELRRTIYSITGAFLLLLAFISLTRTVEAYSRIVLVGSWLLMLLFVPLVRYIVKRLMSYFDFCKIKVFIVGAGVGGEKIYNELQFGHQAGFLPVGFFDDFVKTEDLSVKGIDVLGTLNDLPHAARRMGVDYAILSLPLDVVRKRVKEWVKCFQHIMVIPLHEVGYIGSLYPCDLNRMTAFEVKNRLMQKGPRFVKKALEVVVSTAVTVALFPLMIVLAIFVKLTSPGPIFYRARRLGLGGQPITVYKFRTMFEDAAERLEELLAKDKDLAEEWQKSFKLKDDPRITAFGRFLRRTSLDELPQLLNVLKGDMELIGPRPIVEKEKEMYGDKYQLVSCIKPGITGLWQVSGRSELSYEARVALDSYYIMNWSIWLDYFIFLKTIKEVILCKGAV